MSDEELFARFGYTIIGWANWLMKHIFDEDLPEKLDWLFAHVIPWLEDAQRYPALQAIVYYLAAEFSKRKLPMAALNKSMTQAGLPANDPLALLASPFTEQARQEGIDLAFSIMDALKAGKSIEAVAATYHIGVERVKQIQQRMGL